MTGVKTSRVLWSKRKKGHLEGCPFLRNDLLRGNSFLLCPFVELGDSLRQKLFQLLKSF